MTKRKMKLNKIYNILDMPHLLLVDSPVSGPVEFLHAKGTVLETNEKVVLENNVLSAPTVEADAFITKSDKEFKENIENITSCLEKILALEAKSFNYKDQEQKHIGFIAQDVEKVLPEVVTKDSKGNLYVAYNEIVPLLCQAIKELHIMFKNNK